MMIASGMRIFPADSATRYAGAFDRKRVLISVSPASQYAPESSNLVRQTTPIPIMIKRTKTLVRDASMSGLVAPEDTTQIARGLCV